MINLNDLKKAAEKGIHEGTSFVADKAKAIADDPSKTLEAIKDGVEKGFNDAGDFVSDKAKVVTNGATGVFDKAKTATIDQLDQDNNGQIDITDIIILGMKTPGIRIDRAEFLKKELFKNHTQEVIDQAIVTTSALAGISSEETERLVNEVIKFERNCVSGISAALGMPGGVAMAVTIPADIVQYYGYMLRAAQKMMYLYGFPQIEVTEDGVMIDTETINSLILCLGVMFGVAGANNAIKAMAKALATGVEKQLLKKALTKGTIYPIVKSVAKWFGVKMTKEVFAGFFKNAIPVVGGVIGGGLTFLSFGPCCERLKDALKDTMLSNPENHTSTEEENRMYFEIENGIIDAEFDEIEE